ncbi:MAG: ABC transporter ATP-binding protein [Polyangiales bacterium]
MIRVSELSKSYGPNKAVDSLSFEVETGEVVGFLGPNGAGKTTTIRMMAGYLQPSSGHVTIDGLDASEGAARGRVGYMPESVPMHLEMRVHEYLSYRARLKQLPANERANEIDRVLRAADVLDVKGRIIGQLSKGYRQRVGLADALLGDPPVLILDEPTAGLDPNQIRQVRDLIRSVATTKTVFLSTHILSEVEAVCDRVIILRKGHKVGEGRAEELLGAQHAGRRYTLSSSASVDAIRAVFAGDSAVSSVRIDDEGVRRRIHLRLASDDAGAEALFARMFREGVALSEIRLEDESLEELFRELTKDPTTMSGSND